MKIKNPKKESTILLTVNDVYEKLFHNCMQQNFNKKKYEYDLLEEKKWKIINPTLKKDVENEKQKP